MIPNLVLIALAAVLYWAWKTRDPQAIRIADVMAVVGCLAAFKLIKTNVPLALLAMGGAGWWFWTRKQGGQATERMTHDAARRLLEVPIDATTDEIRAAHRRLVARVHPDVGGSADLTRQVNAARDTLLRRRG